MITLFSKHTDSNFNFQYTCEKDIVMTGLYCQNVSFLSLSSENNSELLLSDFSYKHDILKKMTSPNNKILKFDYTFKKGDIIKGTFDFVSSFNIANAIIFEKDDGLTY